MSNKKTLLITTGGTIACGKTERGLKPVLFGQELVPSGNVEILDLFSLDSTDLSPRHWFLLHEAVTGAVAEKKYDGIVILHGTDTLAWTAALLWHTVPPEIPVVLTGSMLPFGTEGSDASENIRGALICAENTELAGVYVFFAGRIIGGNEAVKRFSFEKDAFRSFSGADCGFVRDGKAVLARKSIPERIYPCPKGGGRVAIVKLSPFSSPANLQIDGCLGAVIESYGAGGLPAEIVKAAEALAEKMPVIMTTGCIGGARLSEYEVGRRALDCGIADGGEMSSECAAVRLYLAESEKA